MSEGAPIGFLWWALPTKLRAAGVEIGQISLFVSLLAFPWALKFLWAPLVDIGRSKYWGLRSWIVSMQILMGVSLLPLIVLDLHADFPLVLPLLFIHAMAAATQDVAIDALCINSTPDVERGSINGWMQVGMLSGRSLFGGGTLLIGVYAGEAGVVLALVAVIWFSALLVLMSREPDSPVDYSRHDRLTSFIDTLRRVVRNRKSWIALVFAGIAGAAYEAVGSVAGPYLIDRGFDQAAIGLFFAGPAVLAMALGALGGGYVSDTIGRRLSVGLFLAAFSGAVLLLALADGVAEAERNGMILPLMVLLYLCIGLFTASSYALFMDLTDPRLGGMQFSAYMGGTNGCESWSAFAVGRLIPPLGYPAAFAIMSLISLATLPLLMFLGVPKDLPARSSVSLPTTE